MAVCMQHWINSNANEDLSSLLRPVAAGKPRLLTGLERYISKLHLLLLLIDNFSIYSGKRCDVSSPAACST